MGLFGIGEKPAEAASVITAEKVTLYRVHVGRRIYGPIHIHDFKRIPGFTLQAPIAPVGTEDWKPAYQVINLQHYFNKPVQNSYTRHASAQDLKQKLAGSAPLEDLFEAPLPAQAPPAKRLSAKRRLVAASLLLVPLLSAGWMGWKMLHSAPVEKEVRLLAIHLIDKALGVLNA